MIEKMSLTIFIACAIFLVFKVNNNPVPYKQIATVPMELYWDNFIIISCYRLLQTMLNCVVTFLKEILDSYIYWLVQVLQLRLKSI